MRILAIGVGGAGSRIMDHLYNHDTRSKANCVNPIVIDIDGNSLHMLKNIPQNARIFFPPIDPDVHYNTASTIDIEEMMSAIQKIDNSEFDSIMIFGGLGGNLIDVIAPLIPELRKAYIEPVYVFCTLPFRREGKARSAKAADDIEMIRRFADAVIVFDNETWHRKLKADFEYRAKEKEEKYPQLNLGPWNPHSFPENPRDIYALLNEKISRQIGLLLRAGEFNDSGFEPADVVLDAGEVLNTLTGHNIVAIGYAIERLPGGFLSSLRFRHQQIFFSEGSHQRATRIVSLAKKAVYENISVPCDLTSAEKALVLIAGPSQELSMRGFQTVRKWIDRSIAGLEMRAGDYPVRNTKFVGIIIMLSGIHNIPRINELREIRKQYMEERGEEERLKIEENTGSQTSEDEGEKKKPSWEEIADLDEEAAFLDKYYTDNETFTTIDDIIEDVPTKDLWNEVTEIVKDDENEKKDPETTHSLIDLLDDYEPEVMTDIKTPQVTHKSEIQESRTLPDFLIDEITDNENLVRERRELQRPLQPSHNTEPCYKAETEMQINARKITLSGKGKKTDQKPLHDNQITIKGPKSEKKPDDRLVMPGRMKNREIDIAGSADVTGPKKPKDSCLGTNSIDIPKNSRSASDNARVGETIRIGSAGKMPDDHLFEGGSISLSKNISPDESAFSGDKIKVSKRKKADDSSLSGGRISVGTRNRINEGALLGEKVSLQGRGKKVQELLKDEPVKMRNRAVPRPNDDMLSSAGKKLRMEEDDKKKKPGKKRPPSGNGGIFWVE